MNNPKSGHVRIPNILVSGIQILKPFEYQTLWSILWLICAFLVLVFEQLLIKPDHCFWNLDFLDV